MAGLVTPYSVIGDFGGGPVLVSVFRQEIIADPTIAQTPNCIFIDGDVVDVDFTTPLTAPQTTALDAIVAAHPSFPELTSGGEKVYQAMVPPTASDDAADGVELGDRWVDLNLGNAYTVVDTTTGAAVWKILGGGALVHKDLTELTVLIPGKRFQLPEPCVESSLSVYLNQGTLDRVSDNGFDIISPIVFELKEALSDLGTRHAFFVSYQPA